MTKPRVLIAGGGIGGMTMALTLHQLGVECIVFEAVENLLPLGVGINIQPNAVRELYDLGINEKALSAIGVQSKEWALVGVNGNDIYTEPRGLLAGYNWPQFSVHRGELQMLLYQQVLERRGPDSVRLGHRLKSYENNKDGSVTVKFERPDGTISEETAAALIGADGLHSAIRAQMYPDQPPIQWGGAVIWRATSQSKPIRSGSSFVGLGTHDQRMVFYPISAPDPETGLATINWIAELTFDKSKGWPEGDWNKRVDQSKFADQFADWKYDWLDVPELIRGASTIYEYPMVDRDPLPTWQDGSVILMGDAAHVMYPTGSNGASQAIVDARVLGAQFVEHGVTQAALAAYDQALCSDVSDLILRNRGAGPFEILNIVDARCGGEFENIDDVIDPAELAGVMAKYKSAAGFAIETLNASEPTIAKGAKVPA